MRTSKTIFNVDLEHKYYYVGNRLQYETFGGSSALWYFYDADGNPSGIRYKDHSGTANDYYFVCNWRGDVMQVYNASGVLVASYEYDAWGKVIAEKSTDADTQNIAEINPIRYRGYYYDTETRLYYLKSRYYDPVIRRFVNADGLISTGIEDTAKNMFAYCLNNPVIYADPDGNCPYKPNSYDFYRLNNGLPAAGCTCKTYNPASKKKPKSSSGSDSTFIFYTEKAFVPAWEELLVSYADDFLNTLILPDITLSSLLASQFDMVISGLENAGIASIAIACYKICWDYDKYAETDINKFYTSATITLAGVATTAAVGTLIAAAGWAVGPTVVVGVGAGVLIGATEDWLRRKNGLSTTWFS